jgi:hypothetical protein
MTTLENVIQDVLLGVECPSMAGATMGLRMLGVEPRLVHDKGMNILFLENIEYQYPSLTYIFFFSFALLFTMQIQSRG